MAAIAAAVSIVACDGGDAPVRSEAESAAPDIVVVVLDTLRIDRTSVFAPERDTTPFLAELAAASVVFENAWSTSSWTAPATASLFTGLYPEQHGVDVGIWLFERLRSERPQLRLKAIPDELVTLPELLREHGYTTFGIADNPNVSRAEGFSSGFDRFASADYRGAAEVNALLARWTPEIRAAAPAFVYLHYMDAHWPYHAHEAHWRAPSDDSSEAAEVARYDAELRYLDTMLRDAIEGLALDQDAILVVVSDHGEELYERGSAMEHRQHGFQLYDELARALLLVRDPSREPNGRRVTAPASLVDVLPTVRARLGLPADPVASGRDLFDPDASLGDRALFAHRREVIDGDRTLRAVVHDGWKYLRTESPDGTVREELYDLVRDPGERSDRAGEEPERLARLRERARAFRERAPRFEPRAARLDVDPEQAERLRALGYADPAPERGAGDAAPGAEDRGGELP